MCIFHIWNNYVFKSRIFQIKTSNKILWRVSLALPPVKNKGGAGGEFVFQYMAIRGKELKF